MILWFDVPPPNINFFVAWNFYTTLSKAGWFFLKKNGKLLWIQNYNYNLTFKTALNTELLQCFIYSVLFVLWESLTKYNMSQILALIFMHKTVCRFNKQYVVCVSNKHIYSCIDRSEFIYGKNVTQTMRNKKFKIIKVYGYPISLIHHYCRLKIEIFGGTIVKKKTLASPLITMMIFKSYKQQTII